MYEVDGRDRVVELRDVPQSSVGAPLPFIMSSEYRLVLAYLVENPPEHWDGSSVRVVGPTTSGETIALVTFEGSAALMFGGPNDEAFSGHPLAGRGLHPYAAFRIEDSSWIRRLERMNAVHPYHKAERFWELQHLVFAFHDSTLECVCRSYQSKVLQGSIEAVVPEMKRLLEQRRRRTRG